jgi:hypothetical protein
MFSMRAHENALAFKPPLPKKEVARFEAPKVDPRALPSVGMEARLLQVLAALLLFLLLLLLLLLLLFVLFLLLLLLCQTKVILVM